MSNHPGRPGPRSQWVDGGGLTDTNSSFHNPDVLYINGPYTDGGGNTFN